MTPRDRVAAVRRAVLTALVVRGVAMGLTWGLGAAVVGTVVAAVFGARLAPAVTFLSLVVVAAVLGVLAFRRAGGARLTAERVALWMEEHDPSLGYALVTALEGGSTGERIAAGLRTTDWRPVVAPRIRRSLADSTIRLAVAIGVSAMVWRVAPSVEGATSSLRATLRGGPGAVAGLVVAARVVPPAYAHLDPVTLSNPTIVRALEGSRVTFSARSADSLHATLDGKALGAFAGPRGVEVRLGTRPAALRLEGAGASRVVALEPVADSAPSVVLRFPARDTVVRIAGGAVPLSADVRDDLGLRAARFEYIVSSGEGETFTFTAGAAGARALGGVRRDSLGAMLVLGQLGLRAGDVVHVRAVAWDARDDTAAALGVSETRSIRVARRGEYDSVAVEAAAPSDADKSILSERMLINLAEALVRRRSALGTTPFRDESRTIARDQARLRRQVSDIIFARLGDDPTGEDTRGAAESGARGALTPGQLLAAADSATNASGDALDFEGGETPVVAVNRPLLEAYNAMWDAGRDLDQADPESALPHMYAALAAIQRARTTERLYLRSRPTVAAVDIARVRLQGTETGTPSDRRPRAADPLRRAALDRFAAALALLPRDAGAAADSLLLLRLELVGSDRAAASAVGDAAAALRSGREATAALLAARRALEGGVAVIDSLGAWSRVP